MLSEWVHVRHRWLLSYGFAAAGRAHDGDFHERSLGAGLGGRNRIPGCTRRDLEVGIAKEKPCSDFSIRCTARRTRGVEKMHRAAKNADLQSKAGAERQFREA